MPCHAMPCHAMVITYSIHASVECIEKEIRKVGKEIQEVEKKAEESVHDRGKWEIFMKEKEQLRELLLIEKELQLQPPPAMAMYLDNIPGILKNYISGITR